MSGFTKLHAGIIHSSVWSESDRTRLVWVTLLAMADRDGVVEASIPGLARAAVVPVPDAEEAVRRLSEPDPYSRTPDHDGRRMEPVAGGWRLLNYGLYREKASPEEAKAKHRVRQARYMAKKKGSATNSEPSPEAVVNAPKVELECVVRHIEPMAFKVRGGNLWGLTPELRDRLESTYGAKLDLEQELNEARMWLFANADKRKTPRGMPKFLNAWMARAGKDRPQAFNKDGVSLAALTQARDYIKRVGPWCQHDPTCADAEAHVMTVARRIQDGQ